MGKRSREKGAQAERAVAEILRSIYPDAMRRVSGEEGQGETLGRDLKGTPGLCVQVKETSRPQPLAAFDEALAAAEYGEIPVAFVRQSSRGSSTAFRVVLSVPCFLKLMNALRGGGVPGHARINEHLARLREDGNMKARVG
jgi:hypothetical protein